MGFQSGLNQALGAVAGAAYAIKGDKEKQEEKTSNLKKDLNFSIAEQKQAEAKVAESELDLENANKDVNAKNEAYKESKKHLDAKGNKVTSKQGKFYAKEAEKAAYDDLSAAQKAETVLSKKHEANKAMEKR